MTPPQTPDVTVLGAGIVGICTALSLVEKGLKVRLVDRDAPGQATSFGNAGIISPWSVVPQSMPGTWKKVPGWLLDPLGPVSIKPSYLPRLIPWGLRFLQEGRRSRIDAISDAMELLNRDCVSQFRHHLQGTGREDLIRDSMYVHAFRNGAAADVNSTDYAMRTRRGARIERIGAADLFSLEPDLSHDFQAAILIHDQARALAPGEIGTVLADKFRRMGGEIQRQTVSAIHPVDDGWEYDTEDGRHASPRLVLSMGVWSAKLLKPLGLSIPLESERGYHVSFRDPGVTLNHSVMDMDMKFVASSMNDGLRVAGTAEFAGLDAQINRKRLDGLIQLARNLLPGLSESGIDIWSGQRPSLPDSLPCIGEIDGFPGLISAFGHSHYGLMMAPSTGRIVADIVTKTPSNANLSAFAPSRF